jgi:hypothetical protein
LVAGPNRRSSHEATKLDHEPRGSLGSQEPYAVKMQWNARIIANSVHMYKHGASTVAKFSRYLAAELVPCLRRRAHALGLVIDIGSSALVSSASGRILRSKHSCRIVVFCLNASLANVAACS